MEIGAAEYTVNRSEVRNEPLLRSALEDADGTNDGKTQRTRRRTRFFFIQQDGVRMDFLRQANGIALAAMAQFRGVGG